MSIMEIRGYSRRVILTKVFSGAIILLVFLTACTPQSPTEAGLPVTTESAEEPTIAEVESEVVVFKLSSSAFKFGDPIPQNFSCDGDDISPPLSWSGLPEGTRSLALIMEDPDAPAGTWIHWVLYNIPAETRDLKAAIESLSDLPVGTQVGENSWGEMSYGGPCPPNGTHRYFFHLFALDVILDTEMGVTSEVLQAAFNGHILAQTELMGTFSR